MSSVDIIVKTSNVLYSDVDPSGKPWLESANFLLGLNIKGLLTECPKCNAIGIPMKKYTRGKKDPVFMFHKNGPASLDLCSIDTKEFKIIRKKIDITEKDVESMIEAATPYVLFSGGLDSLCTLLYVKTIAQRVNSNVKAIHVDTTVGITDTSEYVKEICSKLGVDLRIVKPKVDFFTLARKWGIPSHGYRWCCRELKIKPIAEFLKMELEPRVVFDGIRAAESTVRASYLPAWHHPSFKGICVSPIFYWSDAEVQNYIDEFDLPEKFTGLTTSPECWCGAYKSKSDFEELYHSSPALFDKLAKLEMNNKRNFTFIYENGKRMSLLQLKGEIIRTRV